MPRVKRGVTARARHKKVLVQAKGFRGRRNAVYRIAKEAVMKAGQYASRDRRNKKRVFRALWIARINAAVRELGMTYSVFMNGLKKARRDIDRKVLADLAVFDKAAFTKIAEQAKALWPDLSETQREARHAPFFGIPKTNGTRMNELEHTPPPPHWRTSCAMRDPAALEKQQARYLAKPAR
jgi:large subunit ribosomal protein L20